MNKESDKITNDVDEEVAKTNKNNNKREFKYSN